MIVRLQYYPDRELALSHGFSWKPTLLGFQPGHRHLGALHWGYWMLSTHSG